MTSSAGDKTNLLRKGAEVPSSSIDADIPAKGIGFLTEGITKGEVGPRSAGDMNFQKAQLDDDLQDEKDRVGISGPNAGGNFSADGVRANPHGGQASELKSQSRVASGGLSTRDQTFDAGDAEARDSAALGR